MDCPKCPGTLEKKTYGRKITVDPCHCNVFRQAAPSTSL